jgi:hypothetical protein
MRKNKNKDIEIILPIENKTVESEIETIEDASKITNEKIDATEITVNEIIKVEKTPEELLMKLTLLMTQKQNTN